MMPDATVAPAAPISLLLALPDSTENTEILMGVVDAMLSGATWQFVSSAEQWWSLARSPERPSMLWLRCGTVDARRPTDRLPDPLGTGDTADAAAYRMEMREGVAVHPNGDAWGACCASVTANGWVWHPNRKVAACRAVCAEHAEHPEMGPLCKDVLRRLEGYTR
jgi:hypothetical protein